jgi:hypothetical protein
MASTRRRPRILFAWELGANYGHAAKISEVVAAIGALADVTIAARTPAAFAPFLPAGAARIVQAPVAPPSRPAGPDDLGRSYPDDLRHCGWGDAETLTGLISRWRAVIAEAAPDLLVAQAAPTALLARRTLAHPPRAAAFGSGYDMPPSTTPMPPFQWWVPGEADRVAPREARILATAEAALAVFATPPLGRFAEALRVDAAFLATPPQLDHYPLTLRGAAQHVGAIAARVAGAPIAWRDGSQPKVLAYLRPGTPPFPAALEGLVALAAEADVILAAPGIAPAPARRLASAGGRVVDGPVRLAGLLERASLCVSHGSLGVSSIFLTAGVPQLVAPTQVEQAMIAQALARQGLAAVAPHGVDGADFTEAARAALGGAEVRLRARAAARRIVNDTPIDPAGLVAAGLLGLCERPAAESPFEKGVPGRNRV